MKKQLFRKLTVALVAAAASVMLAPTYAADRTSLTDKELHRVLLTSGFRVRPASTQEQQRQLLRMPDNEFTMVKQGGETYYLYPDKRYDRLFAGDHWAYRAYEGYLRNKNLREQGVFVWELNPTDKANNRTVDIWYGYPPFREF